MKRILFIGLGSAGQRHLRNALGILGKDVEVMAVRHHKSERVFNNSLQVVEGQELKDVYNIKEFSSIAEALEQKPDFAVIANPNSMHIECALEIARAGVDLFIEKPLGVSMDGIDELLELVKSNNIVCQVGFQQRHNPCIIKLKDLIRKKTIGELLFAEAYVGERIDRMHSYEDYHRMVEARQDLGGGVVLCQCHELDHVYSMFGLPEKVYSKGIYGENLGIEVESLVDSVLTYDSFYVRVHQDYFQYPPKKYIEVVGTDGKITVDTAKNMILITKYDGSSEEIIFDKFERNNMFIDEMQQFLDAIDSRKQEGCGIEEAVGSLKIALAIKTSLAKQQEVEL